MENWDDALTQLEPELAQQIRSAASRAGLQAHDPAARLIAEMWVAVAALRAEREQLRQELSSQRQALWENRRLLLAIIVVAGLNLLLFLGWLLV